LRRRLPILLAVVLLAVACNRKSLPPLPEPTLAVPEPQPDAVESVVFLIGDAGLASVEHTPLIHRLRDEVERWSRAVARPGGVVVLYLGDNAYPVGMRDPSDPGSLEDSTHLEAQLSVVTGPNGLRHQAHAIFIAGNHDWGHLEGEAGRDRLDNMGRFIARRSRAGGYVADLQPRASDPAPGILDIGRHLRLLLIDTAWWLLEADPGEKTRVIQLIEQHMTATQNRSIVLAAHHPWTSASAHGGIVPFWKLFGVKWLLSKSGAALQDINSLPYRDLKDRLNRVFEKTGPPMLWAGGHDHALQVIRGMQANEPRMNIVSGAVTKSSKVGQTAGMLYRSSEPGFMTLVAMKSGAIDLFVASGPIQYAKCLGADAERTRCLQEGAAAFRTVYSIRLKD
jgi:hypothetical protein